MQNRFFLPNVPLDGTLTLQEEDQHHIKTVLRLRPGERITVCDGAGMEADCRLDAQLEPVVERVYRSKGELMHEVHLYPSVSKGERFEWLLQKAVELGVSEITPVISERCVVPMPEEKKLVRWAKIVRQAAEQSQRGRIPALNKPIRFPEAVGQGVGLRIFCYEEEQEQSIRDILYRNITDCISLMTGPEGGYEGHEAQLSKTLGWFPVSLGARILRSETAPLFVLSSIAYEMMGL